MEYPFADTGDIYEEMSIYLDDDGFKFKVNEQPSIENFEKVLGEKTIKVAKCVFNTEENFPNAKRNFINGVDFEGKLVDYLKVAPLWEDSNNEYLYCLTYNGKIVKIGMTIKTLKERYGSYMCGTRKAMKKGSCSSTNYVITECNYFAMKNNYEVEIFAIKIPKETKTITRFGITREIEVSIARSLEEMITDKFIDTYGHKPILCVQKGNSTK